LERLHCRTGVVIDQFEFRVAQRPPAFAQKAKQTAVRFRLGFEPGLEFGDRQLRLVQTFQHPVGVRITRGAGADMGGMFRLLIACC
jgi:hypothetical protein